MLLDDVTDISYQGAVNRISLFQGPPEGEGVSICIGVGLVSVELDGGVSFLWSNRNSSSYLG